MASSEQNKQKFMERAAGFTSLEEMIKLLKDVATTLIEAPVFQVIIGIVVIDRLNQTFVEVTDEKGNTSMKPLMATIDASRLKLILISAPIMTALFQAVGGIAAARRGG